MTYDDSVTCSYDDSNANDKILNIGGSGAISFVSSNPSSQIWNTRIVVASGAALDITLQDVNLISSSHVIDFPQDAGNCSITLNGANQLLPGENAGCAIHWTGNGKNTLTIKGTGSLRATTNTFRAAASAACTWKTALASS